MLIRPASSRASRTRRAKLAALGGAALAAVFVLSACGSSSSSSGSKSASTYYEGKTLKIIVPAAAGGSDDILARYLAPLITKYVAGNPKVVVTDVPGGGSLTGIGQFQTTTDKDKDGYTATIQSTSTLVLWAIGAQGVNYSVPDERFIAGVPSDDITLIRKDVGISNAVDLPSVGKKLVVGEQSVEGDGLISVLGWEALGIRSQAKFVFGYSGGGPLQVALEQGEINTYMTPPSGYSKMTPDVTSGKLFPAFINGKPTTSGTLERDPAYPDLPTLGEVYQSIHNQAPSGQVWDAYVALQTLAPCQVLVLNGNAPDAAYQALTAGMTAAKAAADFQKNQLATFGNYPLYVGSDWAPAQAVAKGFTSSMRTYLQNFLETNYKVTGLQK
jgi:tripartite-type tricarboxylate transporter receptor subunit TctC